MVATRALKAWAEQVLRRTHVEDPPAQYLPMQAVHGKIGAGVVQQQQQHACQQQSWQQRRDATHASFGGHSPLMERSQRTDCLLVR